MADLKTRGGAELERDPEDLELVKGMIRKNRNRSFLFQIVAQLVAAPANATIQPFMFRASLPWEIKSKQGALYAGEVGTSSGLLPLVSWKRWGVPTAIQIAKSTFEYSVTSILFWLQPHIEDDLARQTLQWMRGETVMPIIPVPQLPALQYFLVQVSSAVLFFKLEQASLFISSRDSLEKRSVLDLYSQIGFSSMALVLTAIQGFQSPIFKPWFTLLLADYIDNYDVQTLSNRMDITDRARTIIQNRTLTTFVHGFKAFAKAILSPKVVLYYAASGFITGIGQISSIIMYQNTLQAIQTP